MALAIAAAYRRAVAAVPAALMEQWRRTSAALRVPLDLVSHESLSRHGTLPAADIVVVDEAHRFRNAGTKRYRRLAAQLGTADVLLVTATPLVNRIADLANLMALALPDHALATLGIRSIAQAVAQRRLLDLSRALAPITVARTHHVVGAALGRIPRARDHAPSAAPSVDQTTLARLIAGLDQLEFPNVGDRTAAELLRLQLYSRLASSGPALIQTLERHRGYLDRALAAARRGESLSRSRARALFADLADRQLGLDLVAEGPPLEADPSALERDGARVATLLQILRESHCASPKALVLRRLLRRRGRRRTIVFTTATATALDLARSLQWRRVAVVAGGRARIASGPIAVTRALDLFAPLARAAAAPSAIAEVDVLIATDLVSEGLNLQDADTVVHYDLPWSPLRLVQRLGRVARLGAEHRVACIWWFVPPPQLERRIRLTHRIVEKAADQLRLALAGTSSVGRARVYGDEVTARERLARRAAGSPCDTGPARCAAVAGPSVAVVALEWTVRGARIPETLVLDATHTSSDVGHFGRIVATLNALRNARTCHAAAPDWLTDRLRREVRRRLRWHDIGPRDATTRRLVRRILRRAQHASHERRERELTVLDAALEALQQGLRLGALTELERILAPRRPHLAELITWLRRHRPPTASPVEVRLTAALWASP